MEPQLFSCGLSVKAHRPPRFGLPFNGAATFQLRIDDRGRHVSGPHPSFNGAATFQLRIAGPPLSIAAVSRTPSMEPQLFSCGLLQGVTKRITWIHLQWSRNFSVADCRKKLHNRKIGNAAFNGAATFQLRIAESSDKSTTGMQFLQWSRNFSVADCHGYLIEIECIIQPSMEPQLFSCGLNANPAEQNTHCTLPSMEPQLFSCGLFRCSDTLIIVSFTFNGAATFQLRIAPIQVISQPFFYLSFNGAATFQLRIVPKHYSDLLQSNPFNGAATFQLRIAIPGLENSLKLGTLQWSRNFSVADCFKNEFQPDFSISFNGAATFQLRIVISVHWYWLKFWTFNGAATFQLRIVDLSHKPKLVFHPSMEPQLFSCGLTKKNKKNPNSNFHLQWSRNFSVADCPTYRFVIRPVSHLQWSRNFSVADCARFFLLKLLCVILQWSRNFSVADCSKNPIQYRQGSILQWSRNFSVADCSRLYSMHSHYRRPSMEPQLFSCGLWKVEQNHPMNLKPSMEPQLFSCGLKM